jgi:redox-sensitive bicupin YhaK (pirin superfamily)
MIIVRSPGSIYEASGRIEHGTFQGRWHFSFGEYHDPAHMSFGPLRVFNDDTLSPGAVWPLHYHEEIEVVTYCVEGMFRHADQRGEGGVLEPGWVQHTTVGSGMYHSEINASPDAPMRFVQMWFMPDRPGLKPAIEQRPVALNSFTDRLFPLVSNIAPDALRIHQDVAVYTSYIKDGSSVSHPGKAGRGTYLYVLEGGPVVLNGLKTVETLGAAETGGEPMLEIEARLESAWILLIDVPL